MTIFEECHPLKFAQEFFPDVHFYDKQREILDSIFWNDKTVVVAGNMLGDLPPVV